MSHYLQVRLESTDATYTVSLPAFLDAFEGPDSVVVTPEAAYECLADVDIADGHGRFRDFCAANGYTGLTLTLGPRP